jgi:hypothetical protein
MFPRRWQKESDAWRNQRSRSDPMRCRQQEQTNNGGTSLGSDRSSPKDPHIRSLQSHRIVCNRSMKRRPVNDTSSSILLSRACDAARDGTFDETRTGVSPKHPTRAWARQLPPWPFHSPLPPGDTSWLVFQRQIIHSSNLPLTADYNTLHLLSTGPTELCRRRKECTQSP